MREARVQVVSHTDVRERGVRVVQGPDVAFILMLGDEEIARSSSARALVRWAIDRGAISVRSDYDLRNET